jgi:hypothetical protein
MRLIAALAATGVYAETKVEFCTNKLKQVGNINFSISAEVTDPQKCIDTVGTGAAVCDELEDNSQEQHDCFWNWWKESNDDDNYAPEDFANEEFLSNLAQDPMMQEVLAQLNAAEKTLQNFNCAIGDDGEEHCVEKEGTLNPDGTITRSLGNSTQGTVGPQEAGGIASAQDMMKRFVELKQLVSWMQPKDKRISRYCFYGCWCLPDGAHSFVAGEGHPVDLVDRSCQLFWFCYVCAKQEMSAIIGGKKRTCEPEKTKYTFRFKYDKKHPAHYDKRDIICKDNWYMPVNSRDKFKSNCAKAFCECDRGIAMRLYQTWKHWDKSRHRIWSQRVTECPHKTACEQMPINTAKQRHEREVCLRKGCLFVVQDRCTYGAGGRNELDQTPICCGQYEDMGSRFEMRDHGGRYACCNHNKGTGFGDKLPWNGAWYNKVTHCCANGKVESAGHQDC